MKPDPYDYIDLLCGSPFLHRIRDVDNRRGGTDFTPSVFILQGQLPFYEATYFRVANNIEVTWRLYIDQITNVIQYRDFQRSSCLYDTILEVVRDI